MAKIAFKEWQEKKSEETRHIRKIEREERRQKLIESSQERHKKGEVLLAYGLNKNLKKLRERPKSAKPMRKKNKDKRRQHIEFNENL